MDEKKTLAPMIKGITPGLPEIGKIKIGMKGEMRESRGGKKFQLPKKVDHFIVTTLERGDDGNFLRDEAVHQNLGQKPTAIKVSLLYDDPALNFQCRWACFTGTQLWCTGDGENAYRKQKDGTRILRTCPCERNQPDYDTDQYRCKPSGVLSVVLDDMQVVGGVYKFRTTSYNTVVNLMSSLALIQRITGGVLAGIPLYMTIRPKTVIIPKSQKTMQIWIVGLEYRGSVGELASAGLSIAMEDAKRRVQIGDIENVAKKMIGTDTMLTEGESEADIAEEFYPEAVNAEVPETSEPAYTAEDFDNHFADISQHDLFAGFWDMAVSFHSDEHGMAEDELKVDIMKTGADDFRERFEGYVNSASAKLASAEREKKDEPMRNEKAHNTPPKKEPTKKEKLQKELSGWMHLEPQICAEESGGKTPRTIAEYEDLLDRIQARVDEMAEMPGA